ncbi:MAG: LacI family DNA-binding transcriptional regulator [Chloroflexi bacterium]|nr:LacI family DNA-binding transcriptional regulator [Chloroflexota bacterium]
MPTIRDVARKLNISITTVSRALDGYADVSEETRQRVIEAAREMGYVPNRAARQLRRRRTDSIGYIVPAAKPQFADPFFAEFIAGLGDEAASANYDLLVSTAPPNSAEEQALYRRWVQGEKVDGVILNRTRLSDWRVDFLRENKIPFACLERSLDQAADFLGVETEIEGGYLELLGHLAAQGHSHIAFIGADAGLKLQYDRLQAFQKSLTALHIQPRPDLIATGDLTPEGGYQAMLRLLTSEHPPSAVVCVNDLTAIGAMHAAHNQGYVVGRDIAIAGFDGVADSAHTQPPLTTLDQPVYTIARTLTRLLLKVVAREEIGERVVTIQPNLLIRASSGGKK